MLMMMLQMTTMMFEQLYAYDDAPVAAAADDVPY